MGHGIETDEKPVACNTLRKVTVKCTIDDMPRVRNETIDTIACAYDFGPSNQEPASAGLNLGLLWTSR